MRGIRTLFVAILVLIGSIVASAQVTVYVRAGGQNIFDGLTEATAKATIGGANGALTVAGITTLDIGPGDFAGATVTMPLTVNGANAGAAMAAWGAATTLTSPIILGAADADVVFDGVVFGAGSTIDGASAGANVIVSNCKFLRANTISTAGLGWDELSISGCLFDGNNGGAAITNAVAASGLATFFMTENEIRDYAGTAVSISGAIADAVVTRNEFYSNNTGGTSTSAALTFDATSLSSSASFANNLFSDAATTNGIIVSGSIAGKTITIENNLFAGLSGYAISNSGTGMLSAGCNSYGNAPSTATLMAYLNGAIQAGPYIATNGDANGAGIGFVPTGTCTANGPVTISGSANSYFRIQDGVTAVAAGGTVTAGLFTFNESVSVNKSLTITSTDVSDFTRAGAWTTINGTVSVSIGAANFTLNGVKVTSSTATQLVSSSATGSTTILNCLLDVNPTAPLTGVPTNGAIYIGKNGTVTITSTKVSRPSGGFIRALSFGPGNSCRTASITGSEFQGTLQFSGMSLLADVTISNCKISDAGIDGVSFTGNLINTLSITDCDILNSRQNGIGIRDRVTVGNVSASISDNEITGSGKSGSGYAGINIGSLTSGTQSFTDNILSPQDGSNKPFINGRSSYNPTATCNWWGSKSQDVIEASITGGLVLDNGSTDGWRRASSNTGGNGANFDGSAACTVRAFTISLAPSNATCFGSSTGSINNTLSGNTAGAAFTWSNGPTTEDLSNIAAGTYTVTVTTTSENTRSKSATVLEPTELSGSSAKTNITCFGLVDGTITVSNPVGGVINSITPTYNYRIDRAGGPTGDVGPQASGSFTGLGSGTYDVYVIAQGVAPTCERLIGTQVIVEPTQVSGSGAVTSNYNGAQVSCPTSTDGQITITASGGTGTLSYKLGSGSYQASNVFNGLAAGTYTPTVRDANGCERTLVNVVVSAPTQLTVASAVKTQYNGADLNCHNSTNGEITVTAAGGTGTKQYSKDNGSNWQASNVFSSLAAGSYDIKIKDANGCETSATQVVIVAPTQLTVASATKTSYNGADLSCHNSTNGEITVTSAGGTGTKQYSKDNGSNWQASNVFSSLAAGSYNIKIKDANGCETSATQVVIVAPTQLTVASAVKTQYNGADLSCHNSTNGEITVTSAGGTGTKQYSKDNGSNWQASNVFSSLAAGSYNIKIKDANGCETSATQVVIVAPIPLKAYPEVTSDYFGAQLTCPNSSDGDLATNPGGGVTPYAYLWEKNVSGNWTAIALAKRNLENPTGLNAGTYRVTVTDANSCTLTREVEIVPPAPAVILTVTKKDYNGRDVSCFGSTDGEITVVATGGTGALKYSYNDGATWLTGGGFTPGGDPTYTFTGLGAGTYSIVVQDVNGCNSAAQAVTLVDPPTLVISSLINSGPVNAGESITFTATIVGGTRKNTGDKYIYSWAKPRPAANMPGAGSETVNLSNVVTTFTIPVTTADDNGWNTDYVLTVTDANGCTAALSVRPIIYPATIHVATTGNDVTGDGRSVNPLKTIQTAINVADAGNTIEVQTGSYDESPVVTKGLTINGTAATTLGTGRYFVYGTTSTINWGTSWPTSVWDNLGINGDGAGAINTVMSKVNSNSNATLWMIGNISWSSTIAVSKQLALRGATSAAAVPSYTGCDIEPTTIITYTGTGADSVLFRFTGTTAAPKSLRDVVLRIPQSGKYAEIPNTHACNVDPVTNVRFEWDHDNNVATSYQRIYGLTNGAFSGAEKFDVAKFVYDAEDNGYGTGRFTYGNNGPLPWNSLEIGWKAEDGNTDVTGAKIKTLDPMKSDVKLQSLISNSRRPSLVTDNTYFNGKWSMEFDAGYSQYLEATTTSGINGGSEKTVFLVFRPQDTTLDQIIYKHGDQKNGLSIVHLADGRISMNIYDGTTAGTRESWIFNSSAGSHSETGFDDEVLIAQLYFNGNGTNNANRRVGATLDRESGRINSDLVHTGADKDNGYVASGEFGSTALTTPDPPGTANVVSLGARSGSVYYATWNGTAAVDNSITTTGRSLFYTGTVAELLILNTSAESARDAAYCYLRNKYYGGSQAQENSLNKRTIAGDSNVEQEFVSAWPNPADDRVAIEAVIPTSGQVSVTLRDAMGRVAMVLFEEYVTGGTLLPVNGDVRNLASGAYVINVTGAGDLNLSLPIIIRH